MLMGKNSKCFGIDISKDTFDVVCSADNHSTYKNDYSGYKKFFKAIDQEDYCVMEATGYYHYKLAYFLLEKGIRTSVANPLSVKRFIQMKLSKVKTDKSDAKSICAYGTEVKQTWWKGHSKNQQECLQLLSLVDTYLKQSTMLKNKVHGEKVLGEPSKLVLQSLNRHRKQLQKEIDRLETRLHEIIKEEHQDKLTRLESIPGIGRKTAMMLLVVTDGFERFNHSKELCSYAGITPTIRTSGSSVRGKARISKVGNRKLRNMLFLCSFNASKYNLACKHLYDRIVAKGKSKKLALLAVCNKLLKQAFSIVKNNLYYDENYVSRKPVI